MISWESYRYPPFESFPWQRILFLLIPLGLIAAFMYWQENYLGGGVFSAVGAVGIILMLRPQSAVSCGVNDDAVIFQNKRYQFQIFRGFTLVEGGILFIPKKKKRRPLLVPFPDEKEEEKVLQIVEEHLSKTEYEISINDIVRSFFRL